MAGRADWRRQALARATLASATVPPLLARASRAAMNGLWLGVLSDETLGAVDERYYDQSGMYRTEEWNERGLFDWERRLVEEHFGEGVRVAVVACGGGREVLGLLERGYEATGYEWHPALLSFARAFLASRGHPSRVHAAPRDRFPARDEPADAVVLGWGAYSLVHGREARIAMLDGARRRLSPGAPVLLSFFARPVDGRELRVTVAVANAVRRLLGRAPVELGDTLAPNRVHVFTRERLTDELRAGGFALAEYGLIAPADDTTSYASAVARVA